MLDIHHLRGLVLLVWCFITKNTPLLLKHALIPLGPLPERTTLFCKNIKRNVQQQVKCGYNLYKGLTDFVKSESTAFTRGSPGGPTGYNPHIFGRYTCYLMVYNKKKQSKNMKNGYFPYGGHPLIVHFCENIKHKVCHQNMGVVITL